MNSVGGDLHKNYFDILESFLCLLVKNITVVYTKLSTVIKL